MVKTYLEQVTTFLPSTWQHELRRSFFQRQIRWGKFISNEKEFVLLEKFLRAGDWVLDIGGNVGHYTLRMSQLVGKTGRVIAFEPVPETFAFLTSNVGAVDSSNITLLNVAVSDKAATFGINLPYFAAGLPNYYQARLTTDSTDVTVVSLPIDAFSLPAKIRLAKIDVEGHEFEALQGMRQLIERDHPIVIVETNSKRSTDLVESLGYVTERMEGSSNLICTPKQRMQPNSVTSTCALDDAAFTLID